MEKFLDLLGKLVGGYFGIMLLLAMIEYTPKLLVGIIIILVIFVIVTIAVKEVEDKEIKDRVEAHEKKLKDSINFWHNEWLKYKKEYEKTGNEYYRGMMESAKRELELAEKKWREWD